MSIIYDALKKVERSGQLIAPVKTEKSVSRRRIFLVYALVVVSGIMLAKAFWWKFTGLISRNPEVSLAAKPPEEVKKIAPLQTSSVLDYNPAPAAPESRPFVLNGIFFSGEEGYALINNQVVKAGDLVNGALVKSISQEAVELDSEGEVIKLSYSR